MDQNQPRLTTARRRAIDRMLVQCLELPASERDDFLTRCRQRYPRLGRWLVQLAGHGHTVTLLDDSVRHLADDALSRRQHDRRAVRLPPGTRLGPWRIDQEIGHGGMGRVYQGTRADGAFDMVVAIKLIGHRQPGLASLLQRECRLLARLDHPAITRLVDAGLDERAGPFLVMEWVEGTDLRDWLDGNHPDPDARLRLFEQIVEAVAHAHQRLIVHGDIKPGNVRIRADGQVKLMDFGVARLLDIDDQAEGIRALTPSFAAPEQLAGQDITPASDVWALGRLLYWLLTHQSPPTDTQLMASAIGAAGLNRESELSAIIGCATAHDPDERYPSAAHLIDELHRFDQHLPLKCLPPTRRYRLNRFVRRNRLLVGGTTLITAVLLAALVATTWLYLDAEQSRQVALFERDRAEQHAREVEQVVTFQAEQLTGIDVAAMATDLRQQLQGLVDDTPEQAELTGIMLNLLDGHILEPGRSAIDQHFDDQPLVRSRLLVSLAGTRRSLALYDPAEATLDAAMALVDRQVHDTHPVRLGALHQRGLLLADRGDREAAEGYFRQALASRREVLGPDHRDTLTSARQLAVLLQSMGQVDEAEQLYRMTLERRRVTLGEDHPDTIASVHDMGVLALELGRIDEAEDRFRHALEMRRQVLGDNHHSTLTSMANLGVTLRRLGRHEDATIYYVEALERRRETLGHEHPDTLQSINNLAVLMHGKGQIDQAEALYREALAGYESLFGNDNPNTLNTLSNLGVLMEMQDRLERAERYLRRALAGRKDTLGPKHPATMVSKSTLSALLTRLDRADEAIDLSTEVLAFRRSELGERHPQTLIAMTHHAAALRELDQLEEAAELGRRAVNLAREVLPSNHWRLGHHKSQYARTVARISGYEEAEPLLVDAYEIMVSGLGADHVHTRRVGELLEAFQRRQNRSAADSAS
jgi:eukaryotic-like serine/threonine-protein kinase